jgi:hypothetical protein
MFLVCVSFEGGWVGVRYIVPNSFEAAREQGEDTRTSRAPRESTSGRETSTAHRISGMVGMLLLALLKCVISLF